MECLGFETALAATPDLTRLSATVRAHAARCVRCARLLADFEAIVDEARALQAPEPPPGMWDQIRRQLEEEGIIHPRRKTNGTRSSTGAPTPARRAGPRRPRLVPTAPSRSHS